MTTFLWGKPEEIAEDEQGQPRPITLKVNPRMLLALAAALNTADDEALEDEGYSPEIIELVEEAFDVIEHGVSRLFGQDWPFEAMAKNPAQPDLFDE